MTDQVCDPATGICKLPTPNNEKHTPMTNALSNISILRETNVTTLINDKGDPVPITSLPPTPLTLFYCSAVFPLYSLI
jgi:hypothetical protein